MEWLILLLGAVAIHLIFYFSDAFSGDRVDPVKAGQFGDFVGGYIGTAFVLVSVVLLFATLRRQQQQARHENFETRYFQMLALHRANVAEMQLEEESGRKVFVALLKEFRAILDTVDRVAQRSKKQPPLTERQRLHVAYYCLYFGVGPNSSRMLNQLLGSFDQDFVKNLESDLDHESVRNFARTHFNVKHRPFEGHQWRLGHYYRHMFQLVQFVHKQPTYTLSTIEKYDYIRTVRAQLSTHEQALLLLNSLAPIGQLWWREGLMVDYKMVKNLPPDFFDAATELDVKGLCLEPAYFEWEGNDALEYLPVDCRKKPEAEHSAEAMEKA